MDDFTLAINEIFKWLAMITALLTSNWLLSLFLSLGILTLVFKIYFLISS